MPPQALWEDTGGLDRRRSAEIADGDERPDREPPRPPLALRIMLRKARNLDDRKYRLPHRRVEDRELSDLDRRALRRGMGPDRIGLDG